MKVRIFKNEDGTIDLLVQRTRAKENPTMLVRRLNPQRAGEEAGKMVRAVRGEPQAGPAT